MKVGQAQNIIKNKKKKKRCKTNGCKNEPINGITVICEKCYERRRHIRVDSVKDFKAKGFYDRMGFVVYRHGLEDYTWHMQKELNNV